MIKKLAYVLVAVAMVLSVNSCNSSSSYDSEETIYSSTLVKAFSLKKNSKILQGLDSVFFSIDLVNAEIFNADSLPVGTSVQKLQIDLSTDACSKVELIVPRQNGSDTIINYLTNSTDSIDFSNGPVRLHLVSYDGNAERDYTIRVNVHLTEPDLLYWDRMAMHRLPSALSAPSEQKSVKAGDTAVCLTSDGTDFCIAVSDDPAANQWRMLTPAFTFTPEISSLTSTSDGTIYILSADGALYRSSDLGSTWTSTGETWTHIYGSYQSTLLGVKNADGKYRHVTYPATTETDVKPGCPVSATGTMVTLSSRWADTQQAVMAGGRLADGRLTRSVWGFDGTTWAQLSNTLPAPIADVAMIDYPVAQVDSTSWRVKSVPALIILGGRLETGVDPTVYISRDMGVNWKAGDELLQMPDYVASRGGAQALVFDSTLQARSYSEGWRDYESKRLPAWYTIWYPEASRAIAPISQWECPYIYLFGGYDNDGTLFNTLWRGVINRLTFKPLQ